MPDSPVQVVEALQTSFHPQLAEVAAKRREEEGSQRQAVRSAISRLGTEIAYERREREEMVEEMRRMVEEVGEETRREIVARLKRHRSQDGEELASLREAVEELQDQILGGGRGTKNSNKRNKSKMAGGGRGGGTLVDIVRALEARVGALEERVAVGERVRETAVRSLESQVKDSLSTMNSELHALRSSITASFDTVSTRIDALESTLASHTSSVVSPADIDHLKSALAREQSARLSLEHNVHNALHLAITSLHQDLLQSL